MLKKNLFLFFIFYLIVLQLFVIGVLRNDPRFHILGGVNLFAFFLIARCYKAFTKDKEEKSDSTPLVREKISNFTYTDVPSSPRENVEEEREIEKAFPKAEAAAPLSESNIEYIKTKINRSKKPALIEGSGRYRFAMFLLAIIGFGGIMYMFWDTFDFFAVLIGAIGMLIFLTVVFKAANLWRKTIFLSGYVLFFLILAF